MKMLAIYDISHPKRLYRVAKIMKDYGIRVQKSKFEIEVTLASFAELKWRINRVISHNHDGIKYIPLCEKCLQKTEIIGLGKYIDPDLEFYVL